MHKLIDSEYKDEQGDLVTIGSNRDLVEGIKWMVLHKSNRVLHLFIISKDENRNVLHGITNLLLNMTLEDKMDQEGIQVFHYTLRFI